MFFYLLFKIFYKEEKLSSYEKKFSIIILGTIWYSLFFSFSNLCFFILLIIDIILFYFNNTSFINDYNPYIKIDISLPQVFKHTITNIIEENV